jgi:hypothetical protein
MVFQFEMKIMQLSFEIEWEKIYRVTLKIHLKNNYENIRSIRLDGSELKWAF